MLVERAAMRGSGPWQGGYWNSRMGLWMVASLTLGLWASASGASESGKKYFYSNVVPQLAANGCQECHTVGYVRPQVFTYEDAIKYLAMGDSPLNSVILYKIANLRSIAPDRPTHPGNKRCASVDAEPCKTITQWWHIEFGSR